MTFFIIPQIILFSRLLVLFLAFYFFAAAVGIMVMGMVMMGIQRFGCGCRSSAVVL